MIRPLILALIALALGFGAFHWVSTIEIDTGYTAPEREQMDDLMHELSGVRHA